MEQVYKQIKAGQAGVTFSLSPLNSLLMSLAARPYLQKRVYCYLGYFPAQYPITVRHLLTHSSGLPEPMDFLMVNLRLKGQPLPDFDSVDREFYEGVSDLMFEPGSQSAYVNPDYVTLGQVIAAVSGQPYVEYVLEHILNPLGMTNTDFTYSNDFMEANAAGAAVPIAEAEALVPLMDEARGLGDAADFFRETGENYVWMNHISSANRRVAD